MDFVGVGSSKSTRMHCLGALIAAHLLYSLANGDGWLAALPESQPAIEVTQHPNWNLLEHDTCGTSMADRIIGGVNASLGAYPWIARLGYTNAKSDEALFRCGATLINKLYVVTAAHCVTALPTGLQVSTIRLGEFNSETDTDCDGAVCAEPVQDFSPSKLLVHKDYGNPAFKNDIAIIRLDREAVFNGWVMPICLPFSELLSKEYLGQLAEVAGWGIYDISNPKASIVLQTIKLPVVELDRCIVAFKKHASINGKQMCVGGRIGQDSCGGDSGGPLMKVDVLDGPPRYYYIGIVSFGAKHCGSTTMPAVYTRISAYMDWILDNITP